MTTLGMKNLERVAGMLMTATTTRPGEPYADLEELYARLRGQWSLEMNHVAAIVGGYNSQQKHIGQNGVRFLLIPRVKQENAVKFLLDNAFRVPAWAINPEILRRIEPVGLLDRIEASQTRVLNSLLSSPRVLRMVEQGAIDGTAAYDPLDFLPTCGAASGASSIPAGAPRLMPTAATCSGRTSTHSATASTARRRSQTMRERSSGAN